MQRHLLAQVVAESDLLGQTIRNALLRAMLQDRRSDAYLVMQDIGRHAFGLVHCGTAGCVMARSPAIHEVDEKSSDPCEACRARLAARKGGE